MEIIYLLIGLNLYCLPTVIAGKRHHPDLRTISFINFFLGWTVLGWIAALGMALTGRSHAQEV